MSNEFEGKTVILGVTGGIACYKAAYLTSELVRSGADVHVIMTESACQFVQPLTFQTLSRNYVFTDTFDERDPQVVSHIDLADRADLVILAPATANIIGKLSSGIADDMLSTTLLATTAPVFIAPAMNGHMYEHPAVKRNLQTLESWGYHIIEPAEGMLACGYVGKGRLEEPHLIFESVKRILSSGIKGNRDMMGIKVLVTAGATREKLDPVRFFTNRSTGKMGYAVAEAARDRGAEVILVSGKTSLEAPEGVELISVESAQEMYDAVMSRFDEMDVVVKAAAVADYRPAQVYGSKLKKGDGPLTIEMSRTKDILKTLGERKKHQFLIGFAAESENVEENARRKIESKNADMIVANHILQDGAGFEGDTNIVTLFDRNGKICDLPMLSKRAVADRIWDEALSKGLGEGKL